MWFGTRTDGPRSAPIGICTANRPYEPLEVYQGLATDQMETVCHRTASTAIRWFTALIPFGHGIGVFHNLGYDTLVLAFYNAMLRWSCGASIGCPDPERGG
jgi:hypothetical protein